MVKTAFFHLEFGVFKEKNGVFQLRNAESPD